MCTRIKSTAGGPRLLRADRERAVEKEMILLPEISTGIPWVDWNLPLTFETKLVHWAILNTMGHPNGLQGLAPRLPQMSLPWRCRACELLGLSQVAPAEVERPCLPQLFFPFAWLRLHPTICATGCCPGSEGQKDDVGGLKRGKCEEAVKCGEDTDQGQAALLEVGAEARAVCRDMGIARGFYFFIRIERKERENRASRKEECLQLKNKAH